MTRYEFLDQLRRALGSRVDSNVVNENVSYYEEYIATQVRTGRTEEEVIEELGDPRLLARSIAEAKERKGGGVKTDADTEEKKPFLTRTYHLPGWLLITGVILLILLALGMVFSILRALIPIILPLVIIGAGIRMLQKK